MLGIVRVYVFDTKVVNYETKSDVACRVVAEAWCVVGREVSKLGEVLYKAVMGDLAGLGEDVHSLADIDNDVATLDEQ